MRLREILPQKYFTTDFQFPPNLEPGRRFASIAAIDEYLRSQAARIGAPLDIMINDRDLIPCAQNWKSVRYRCKICRIAIRFSRRGDSLITNTVNSQHYHSQNPSQRRSLEDSWDSTSYKESVRSLRVTRRRVSAMRSEAKSKEQPWAESPLEEIITPGDTLNDLVDWFEKQQYRASGDFLNRPKESNVVVAVSQTMLNSYARFGDLVQFKLIEDPESWVELEGRWRIGMFVVFDTNQRALLAGLAFFREQTSDAMNTLFRTFLSIHKEQPKTLVTDRQECVQEAVHELKNVFTGFHLQSFESKFDHLCKGLQGSKVQLANTVYNIRKLLLCQTQDEFCRIFDDFKKDAMNGMRVCEAIQKQEWLYIQHNEARSFLGLGDANPSKLMNTIKQQIRGTQSLLSFLREIDALHIKQAVKSANKFSRLNEDIAVMFGNPSLSEVRVNYEERVAERFLRNYVEAMREWALIGKFVTPEHNVAIVKHLLVKENTHEVHDRKCDCREFERTGVACAHLIMLATEDGESYRTLINERWRKTQENAHNAETQ